MKTVFGLTVFVSVTLNLTTLSTGIYVPKSLDVQHAMESFGTAELILRDANFQQYLPTMNKLQAVITMTLRGNGRTGLLTLYKIQKSLTEEKKQNPSKQAFTKVIVFIVREDAEGETKTPIDDKSREKKLEEFQPIFDALEKLLPKDGLIVIKQDEETTLEEVLKKFTPESTAVKIDAKVGARKATDNIQPKLVMGTMIDAYLTGTGVPILANDLTSGMGSKNAKDMLLKPTSVISANRVSVLQRPQGLILLENNDSVRAKIHNEILAEENKMEKLKKPTGKGDVIKVAYVTFQNGKTEEEVETALKIANEVVQNWVAGFDLLKVEIAAFPLP